MASQYSLGLVIPIYNVEAYLQECLDSVVNQTIPFDEVILVNDGSLDRSKEICESYCKKYFHMKLINQKNQGLGAARNHGMEYLKSDYLVFLDSDDRFTLQAVETIKNRLKGQDVLFYSSEIQEDIEGVIHPNIYIRKQELCNCVMNGLDYFYQSYPENYVVSSCMGAYERAFLNNHNIRFPEGFYYEDNSFHIEIVSNAKKVEVISNPLYIRRYRPNSIMTSVLHKKKCLDKMEVQIKIWNYIQKNISVKWRNHVFYSYLLREISETIFLVEQCEKSPDLQKNEIRFLEMFSKNWGEEYKESRLFLGDYFILLKIYGKLAEINREKYELKYKKIKNLFIETLKGKLECLCLNEEDMVIGIYGMGKHTTVMLDLYEKYIGKVKAKIFYIISEKEPQNDNLENQDHKIVSYNHIPKGVDQIIISSWTYGNEMVSNLKTMEINPQKICLLYEPKEDFDLVRAYEFLYEKMEESSEKESTLKF